MIFHDDEDRERREQELAEMFRDMNIISVPAPPPGADRRPAWPLRAFDDLEMREQPRDEDVCFYSPDDDLPGDSIAEVEIRTAHGKIIEVLDILDLPRALKEGCPASYARLRDWMFAAAADRRSPGVLN
jgi:hypothetical protein